MQNSSCFLFLLIICVCSLDITDNFTNVQKNHDDSSVKQIFSHNACSTVLSSFFYLNMRLTRTVMVFLQSCHKLYHLMHGLCNGTSVTIKIIHNSDNKFLLYMFFFSALVFKPVWPYVLIIMN